MSGPMGTLLTLINRFIRHHAMHPTRFGRDAIGDPHLIKDLREGRRLLRPTERRIRAFMRTYKPKRR